MRLTLHLKYAFTFYQFMHFLAFDSVTLVLQESASLFELQEKTVCKIKQLNKLFSKITGSE